MFVLQTLQKSGKCSRKLRINLKKSDGKENLISFMVKL